MALKIRLRRMGRKKAPHYRIVVAESSFPRDGRFVANLGHYNPTTNPATLVVDRDKALAWIGKGAMPTDTVQSLLKQAGVFKEPSTVEDAVAAAGGVASRAAGAVKTAASTVAGTAATAASTVASTAASVASTVAETATSAASTVVEAVRDAAGAVAERVTGGDEGDAAPAPEAPAADDAAPAAAEGEQPQG
ncbi:MAG TPA: 30S ribosomal protein S16 [Longimicrobiaceae bacterium]|nr:30S ribosomal protein S16 [Longimicrobiaceae bacterium]